MAYKKDRNADKMNPENSPDRALSPGVRRVNNLPIYIIMGIVLIFSLTEQYINTHLTLYKSMFCVTD